MPDQPQPKRRWLQISLRTLLIVVTALCIWLGLQANAARKQHVAVAKLLSLGGSVAYDYQFDEKGNWKTSPAPSAPAWLRSALGDDYFCSPTIINFDGPAGPQDTEVIGQRKLFRANPSDNDLALIADLPKLTQLTLSGTRFTDDGLRNLAGLSRLEILTLKGTKINGSGLQHFSGLSKLRILDLQQTALMDASLAEIGRLTNLKVLYLGETPITDDGLKHLANLSSLVILELCETKITDTGLSHLSKMTSLEVLNLHGTKVTDACLGQLSGLSNLKVLMVGETGVTEDGCSKLLPKCKLGN